MYLGHWDKLWKLGPNTPNLGHVIQSVKPHISRQVKLYSNVKETWESINTCFVFVKLGQAGEVRTKKPKSWTSIHRKSSEVLNSTSHQIKHHSSVKAISGSSYICFSIFWELGQVGEIGPKYPKSWAPVHRKSFILVKLLNSTFHIKWNPTHM